MWSRLSSCVMPRDVPLQLARQLLPLRADARTPAAWPLQEVDLKDLVRKHGWRPLSTGPQPRGLDLDWRFSPLLSGAIAGCCVAGLQFGGKTPLTYAPRWQCHTALRICVLSLWADDDVTLLNMPGVEQWAYVEVDDDGPGVPEEERRQITQRFYIALRCGGRWHGFKPIADESSTPSRSFGALPRVVWVKAY